MKQSLLFLLCALFSVSVMAQQVPNGDFELWTGTTPNEWDTSNENVLGTQFTTVSKITSGAQSGSFAAKVETQTKTIFMVGPVTLPGILTLGDFNLDIANQSASLTGGEAFTHRPYSLRGYYKVTPAAGDTPLIGVGISKWNEETGERDTLGFGLMYFGEATSTWTAFEIVIEYTSTEIPDTMNVIIASSDLMNNTTFINGSTISVDNLSFYYPPALNIVSIAAQQDVTVNQGTAFADLSLPAEVEVSLDNATTTNLSVIWQEGGYNPDVADTYTLTGIVQLVDGILNPLNLTAQIQVIVNPIVNPDREIVSVQDFNPIEVDYMTEFGDLNLPETAVVTLDDESTEELSLVWLQGDYDGSVPGSYFVTGTLVLVDGILNTANITAEIQVVVNEEVVPNKTIVTVQNFAGFEVDHMTAFESLELPLTAIVYLDDETTETLNVEWLQGDYPADGDMPGTYTLTGNLQLIDNIINPQNITAEITVTINEPNVIALSKAGFKVYPNPTSEIINVQLASTSKITISNLAGNTVFSCKAEAGEISIDVSKLPAANYLMSIETEKGIHTLNIIVQ